METLFGMGKLIHESIIIPVSFTFHWHFEASNKGRAKFVAVSKDSEIYDIYESLPFFPWALEGVDSHGRPICAERLSLTRRQGKINGVLIETILHLNADDIHVGESGAFDTVLFYIPNTKIGYDYKFQDFDGTNNLSLSTIELSYGGYKYNIKLKRLISEAKEKEKISLEEDFISIEMNIEKLNGYISDIEAQKLAQAVLEVMEIAYGNIIYWSEMKGLLDNDIVYHAYRNARYPKSSHTRQLIKLDHPRFLSGFILKTFDLYQNMLFSEREALLELIRGVRFAAERLNFPVPFVQLGSTIEKCCVSILGENKEYYMNKKERRRVFPDYKEWVQLNIIPNINKLDQDEFIDSLSNKFSFLLQKTFRTRLTNLLNHYQIKFNPIWISEFVKMRNEAAHGGYQFNGIADYMIWTRVASLLERIIMKRMMYDQAFWDNSTSPSEYKILN